MNPDFWKGKRVFITGHTGFKGGWLSLWLQSLGAEVHGYSLAPPTNPNLFSVARIGEGMASSTIADIRDFRTTRSLRSRESGRKLFSISQRNPWSGIPTRTLPRRMRSTSWAS